jgi:hypothetical protein
VPATCTYHSDALRMISHARHARGLAWLASLLGGKGGKWRVAEMETGSRAENHNDKFEAEAEATRNATSAIRMEWESRQRLKPPADRQTLHFKPDLILVRKIGGITQIKIIDMAFRTDTHLRKEEVWSHKPASTTKDKPLQIQWSEPPFDTRGTAGGPKPPDWPEDLYDQAQTLPWMVQAQYACRYKQFRRELQQRLELRPQDVQVITIAVGVMGYVPHFTRASLDDLLGKTNGSKPALPTVRHIAWDFATRAWKAFRNESC